MAKERQTLWSKTKCWVGIARVKQSTKEGGNTPQAPSQGDLEMKRMCFHKTSATL